jgi:rare lipoprotein A
MSRGIILKLVSPALLASALLYSTASLPMTLAQESGIASVYAYSGEETANGETASPDSFTAAHRTLPFGTLVRVTNDLTGSWVVVRINDRGPFVDGRIIDLTPAGADAIGSDGLAHVSLQVLGRSG